MAANSFFGEHVSFLVRPRVFLRPDHDSTPRRAQPLSRLAGTALLPHGHCVQATS